MTSNNETVSCQNMSGQNYKIYASEGNSALLPTTAVVRKQSMIEGGVMMAFGCQPIFESHTRI